MRGIVSISHFALRNSIITEHRRDARAGGWRLEAGGWRLEAGGWRLEAELPLTFNL
jgi:hypothetical protein